MVPNQQAADINQSKRQSIGELVRTYSDSSCDGQKRDRSESGDLVPAGKRGAKERSGEPARSSVTGISRNFGSTSMEQSTAWRVALMFHSLVTFMSSGKLSQQRSKD